MKKFCIFCGQKPISKNLEHVIPQWLINLTGDPRREIILGIPSKDDVSSPKRYSFNSFKFPSCQTCNSKFSELEAIAKPIIEKILNDDSLSASDFNIFFNWLDKVRIGLWLAFFYLTENQILIDPAFHITYRIGIYDRMVAIYKVNDNWKGIHFLGTNTPAFQLMPSCFTLAINNYYFFNLSTVFLFSRRIGFPYPLTQEYDPFTHRVNIDLYKGKSRVMYPLIRKAIWGPCKQIYQPIFSCSEITDEIKNNLYGSEYVKNNSLDWTKGIGCIYLQHNGKIANYSFQNEKSWIPELELDRNISFKRILAQTLNFQLDMLSSTPTKGSLTSDHKRFIKEQMKIAKLINRKMVKLSRNT